MNVNKSHISGEEENCPVAGNPATYFGAAIIAYLDILGFSNDVLNDWGEHDNSPLAKLHRIIEGIPEEKKQVKINIVRPEDGSPISQYRCNFWAISDSIIIAVAIPNTGKDYEFENAALAIYFNISQYWQHSICNGYTIRGAIELGDMFWNESECIGPALVNAYNLEKKADWSRVVLGKEYVKLLVQIATSEKDKIYKHLVRFLRKDTDSFISIDSKLFLNKDEYVGPLREMQRKCEDDYEVYQKYENLLGTLCSGSNLPSIDDLKNYCPPIQERKKGGSAT
jgi:hypothetical protein